MDALCISQIPLQDERVNLPQGGDGCLASAGAALAEGSHLHKTLSCNNWHPSTD